MQYTSKFYLVILLLLVFFSCKKDKTTSPLVVEGTLSLNVHAVHHSIDVPAIIIYLKKGVTTFPGNDSSIYNFREQADAYGRVTFTKLFPGSYYVYASGYDSLWQSYVTGNIPIILDTTTLSNNEASITVNVSE